MRFALDLRETGDRQPPGYSPSNSAYKAENESRRSRSKHGVRFALDPEETYARQSPATASSISASKAEIRWVPLQNHPLFSSASATAPPVAADGMPTNLIAWDGASRLYIWDLSCKCLHRISIRLGEPEPSSILAAFPSKLLRPDVPLSFEVQKVAINRDGSALFLVGLGGLGVIRLYGRSSVEENTIICRTTLIGTEIYINRNNFIRILQISWHPCSETHLGILSTDSVFRIFDLSTDFEKPEQEYYLQPVEPGIHKTAAAIRPVDFSFGGSHLWDRFSVFILFSDGSCYIICPVVPFGSMYNWESILEIYNDAQTFGHKSASQKAIKDSSMAISWLEATFPELVQQPGDSGKPYAVVKARPFVLLDSSVSLQGPLRKVLHSTTNYRENHEGRATSLLYNLVGKDSVLVTAWSGGQLQVDALADEIQPTWNLGSAPRIFFGPSDQILGAAMICETSHTSDPVTKLDQPLDHTVWLGHPPPLLSLAIVDLSLPKTATSPIVMFADPLVPERTFCVHAGGVDSIILHFLPFTHNTSSKDGLMRPPSVLPVLGTLASGTSPSSPLLGFLVLSDSFGSSWIVGLTSLNDCVVLQMETWSVLLTDIADKMKETVIFDGIKETEAHTIISKELLVGPKGVLLPASAANSRALSADSIEGRAMLHQYFKLFHENYVEYAHKVYFELEHHAPHVKEMIKNQHSRLQQVQQKMSEVERKQEQIENRIDRAVNRHKSLEERLLKLRNLPGSHKKPLSKAERDCKAELDRLTGMELDALHSAIESLNARLKKHTHSSPQKKNSPPHRKQTPARLRIDDEVSQLRSSVEKLSLVNSANSTKVKLIEDTLRNKEISD